ncbi:MAG: YjjW family glycine radical enzyme activase [Pseudoflavonifractor sp.]
MITAPVNHIIPQSCVDGPGNRSVVFFQGCNFNCRYCHNPETIHQCQNCGLCVAGCPTGALSTENGLVSWQEELCVGCDSCLRACPHGSSPRVSMLSTDQVMARVAENMPFIRGITVSGGECSLYHAFVAELFTKARALGLGTLMDSNGSYDFSADPQLLALCDGVMLDGKAFDPQAHLALTDASNQMVLQNAVFLARQNKLQELRTVVALGLPNEETVVGFARLLAPHLARQDVLYKLIRYRASGVRTCYSAQLATPPMAEMERLRGLVQACGFSNISIV